MKVRSYRDLIVWQKAIQLVDVLYDLTEEFPQSQRFSLADQMQRAAVSIPSNIAEGSRRSTRKDYRNFLIISYSSGAELETQLELSRLRSFGSNELRLSVEQLLNEVMRMLNKMIQNLKE